MAKTRELAPKPTIKPSRNAIEVAPRVKPKSEKSKPVAAAPVPRPDAKTPVPVTGPAQDAVIKKKLDDIDGDLWPAVLKSRQGQTLLDQTTVQGYWNIGRNLLSTYKKHQKNNTVTSLICKALDLNIDYLYAALSLANMYDEKAFAKLLSDCTKRGKMPSWSVVRRFRTLKNKSDWDTAFNLASKGEITMSNIDVALLKILGLPVDEAVAKKEQRELARPSSFDGTVKATVDKLTAFSTYVAGDQKSGGISKHMREVLSAAPDRWTVTTLNAVDNVSSQLRRAADVAIQEANEAERLIAEVRERLRKDHKLTSADEPPLGSSTTTVRASGATVVAPAEEDGPPIRPASRKRS
jgi:hypothetical protein